MDIVTKYVIIKRAERYIMSNMKNNHTNDYTDINKQLLHYLHIVATNYNVFMLHDRVTHDNYFKYLVTGSHELVLSKYVFDLIKYCWSGIVDNINISRSNPLTGKYLYSLNNVYFGTVQYDINIVHIFGLIDLLCDGYHKYPDGIGHISGFDTILINNCMLSKLSYYVFVLNFISDIITKDVANLIKQYMCQLI